MATNLEGNNEGERQFPPSSLDGSLAAAQFTDALSQGLAQNVGGISTNDRVELLRMLAPGYGYFYDLAGKAGELAGSGDALGALALLGGEDNARAMLGDDGVDGLLAEATLQMAGELEGN